MFNKIADSVQAKLVKHIVIADGHRRSMRLKTLTHTHTGVYRKGHTVNFLLRNANMTKRND